MGLDLHPARPATEDECEYYGNWYYDPAAPSPQWSYGGFSEFRRRLAAAEGFDLDEMAGFCAGGRDWSEVTTDLEPLLNHSDCDGEMSADECRRVYPRLEQVVTGWDATDDFAVAYDKQAGAALVAAMRMVAEGDGLTLVFR